jgi:hypothetical protein
MRTLGIDLSTAETQTAACVLDWDGVEGRDLGAPPRVGLSDGALLQAMAQADYVGIDAPFGWPDPFRVAIDAWSERGEWLAGPERGAASAAARRSAGGAARQPADVGVG